VKVPIGELETAVKQALVNIGHPEEDAEAQKKVMCYAELHGNNQGIAKLYDPTQMAPLPGTSPLKIVHETPISASIDGGKKPGMVALTKATDMVIEKAKRSGFAICGTHNTPSSTGMLAYYARKVAECDLIALVFAVSPEFVAPYGGKQAVFGTNPLTWGIPSASSEGPLVFDMATAGMTLFGAITAKATNSPLPEGVGIDKEGNPTTDPHAAFPGNGGAFLPIAGHKGSGLALIVELLGGVLPGAAIPGQEKTKAVQKSWGNTIIAIDPALLYPDVQGYKEKVAAVCAHVKGSGSVKLPGEIEAAIAKRNTAAGTIEVGEPLWAKIRELAASPPAKL